jgi:hypothetical protein
MPVVSMSVFRVVMTMTTRSSPTRRAIMRSAHSDGASIQCRSSATTRSGCRAAASDSSVSAARPASNGEGWTSVATPNATSRARRCGAGRSAMPPRNGYRSMWSAAYGSADSARTPVVVITRSPRVFAYSTRSATNDDLPIPASPSITNAEPPLTTSRTASRRAALSRVRPMTGWTIVTPSVWRSSTATRAGQTVSAVLTTGLAPHALNAFDRVAGRGCPRGDPQPGVRDGLRTMQLISREGLRHRGREALRCGCRRGRRV